VTYLKVQLELNLEMNQTSQIQLLLLELDTQMSSLNKKIELYDFLITTFNRKLNNKDYLTDEVKQIMTD